MKTQKYPILKNPPLKEALLDIRAEIVDDIDVSRLGKLPASLASLFTVRKELTSFAAEIKFTGTMHSAETKPTELIGYEFHSADDSLLMRLDKTGCSIHQLSGYTEWEEFIPIAHDMWEHYSSIGNPHEPVRLGLRYINQVRLDLPFSLSDYFNFSLNSPADLPFSLIPQMLTQFTLSDQVQNQYGIVTLSLISVKDHSDKVDVYFDIDIGKSNGLDVTRIWTDFDQMRDMKNEIFFRGITAKTLEMIDF